MPAWWWAPDHSQPSPATLLSAQSMSPSESQGNRRIERLWSYLCVYLIFCYSFQEFELLLIWGPGFWQLFSLKGFMPSCQLSKDSRPRIMLTGSLRTVKAEQRHGKKHWIKERSAFCVYFLMAFWLPVLKEQQGIYEQGQIWILWKSERSWWPRDGSASYRNFPNLKK